MTATSNDVRWIGVVGNQKVADDKRGRAARQLAALRLLQRNDELLRRHA
jgi:hypothetical protein